MIDKNKKYRTRDGQEVRILCTDARSTKPVIAHIGEDRDLIAFYSEGMYRKDAIDDLDLIEVSPYDDFKIDAPVMVSACGNMWKKQHFAGVDENGKCMTWANGTTSWSEGGKTYWEFCRRPTAEELK